MKRKYFKVDAFFYFTILIYFAQNNDKTLLENVNNNAEKIRQRYKFNKLVLININKDYLTKMLKCCGNLIFNKNEKFYFAKPEEVFPVFLYFHYIFKKKHEQNIFFQQLSTGLLHQLEEYDHIQYKTDFLILNNPQEFVKYEIKAFKGLIQFLNNYYKTKIVVIKRRKNV